MSEVEDNSGLPDLEPLPSNYNPVAIVVKRVTNGENVGALSCGEQIAAAFIFNRMDWLPSAYSHPVDAIDRLGDTWLQMVLDYRRHNS